MDIRTANTLDKYLTCPPEEEEFVDDTPRDWEGNEIRAYNQVYELMFKTTFINSKTLVVSTSTKIVVATDETGSLPDALTEFGIENLTEFKPFLGEEWLSDWRANYGN